MSPVKNCPDCIKYKSSNQKPSGLLQTPVPVQRFETLAIGLFGPLPESKDGKRWNIIIEDCTTKWVELFALPNATAKECAITLIEEVLLSSVVPKEDNSTVPQPIADLFVTSRTKISATAVRKYLHNLYLNATRLVSCIRRFMDKDVPLYVGQGNMFLDKTAKVFCTIYKIIHIQLEDADLLMFRLLICREQCSKCNQSGTILKDAVIEMVESLSVVKLT
ncbi:integrase_H2C2 domain-containing protein [Trichonephila clavipes]|nr:integrase_H2C2 domain-containing protein [Trichonephila clavipes]